MKGQVESERVPMKQAAKELGVAQETVRYYMMIGRWDDLGDVIPPNDRSTRYRFIIYRSRLDKHLGRERKTDAVGREH
ncbi:hypothetical protein BEI61_03971 [Eisenbergiella tayi]|uniref:MerR family transcriptional regulator n=2 Tax=Eisenbergiella tayi TaxID=1432052 RepID=A0A1E3A3X9_9FIRM|nr:hypothetical protein BEI61_03971 [Eisenbergiella tayi]